MEGSPLSLGLTFCAAAIICLAKTNTLAALILGSCASHTCAAGTPGGDAEMGLNEMAKWAYDTSCPAIFLHVTGAPACLPQTAGSRRPLGTNTAGASKPINTADTITQLSGLPPH